MVPAFVGSLCFARFIVISAVVVTAELFPEVVDYCLDSVKMAFFSNSNILVGNQ